MAEHKKNDRALQRARILEQMGTALGGDKWARSDNPIKQRIGRLEVAWREAIQWLLEDIRKMFANFDTVATAYDIVDINIASVKSLCIEKGVFTDEEFERRQKYFFGVLDAERARRQAELEAIEARAKEEAAKPPEEQVDADLVQMHESAAATTDEDHIPAHAIVFGG